MRHHFYAAAAFTLLSSFTSFLSVANSQDLDVSDSPYGLFADSALDSSTDVDFIDPNSSSSYLITSTSDDPLFGDLPADSNNLLGQDDLLDQDLMLSSNDQCSFDAASIDADGFLDPIVKRESGPACKIRQQGSTSNKVPQPPEDPQDFLNNLPFFEGHEDPVLHERTEICKPQFTANRGIPMCLIGVSELALQSGQYFPEGLLVGCAPCMSILSRLIVTAKAHDLQSGSIAYHLSGRFRVDVLQAG